MAGIYTEAYNNLLKYIYQLKEAETGQSYIIDDKTNEDCLNYQEKLNNLVNITRELYERDGFGNMKSMTQEQFDNLMGAYKECITQSEKLATNPSSPYNPEVIHNIQNLLSKDYSYLNTIDRNHLVPLPVAMEQARGRVIDLGGVSINSYGGQANSRKAVALVDENGNTINGFFTVEKPILLGDKTQEAARERLRLFKKEISVDWFKSPSKKKNDILSPEQKEAQFRETIDDLFGEPDWGLTNLSEKLDKISPPLRKYYDLLIDLRINKQVYEEDLQIPLDEYEKNGMTPTSDKRNIAMSAVANLIGAPDAVARTYSVTAKDGDNLIHGTFMENIEGVNRDRVSPDDPFFEIKASEYRKNGHILKRIADIQILDYICQNIDRHSGNLMFIMEYDDSGRPKLKDIKGIDNDASFGVRQVANNERINNDTAFNHIKVISKSVCDKIMSLDKSMLTATLKGYGLVDSEIDAAWKRTENLQSRLVQSMARFKDDATLDLRTGYIRVVPDDQFGNLNLGQLIDSQHREERHTLFTEVNDFFNHGKRWAKEDKQQDIKKIEFAQVSVMNGNVGRFLTSMNTSFNAFYSKLQGSEGFLFTIGGNEYREMRDALANVIHLQEAFSTNEADIDRKQFQYIASLEILKDKCKKYIDYKKPKVGDIETAGARAKSRLEVADKLFHSIDKMVQTFHTTLARRDEELVRVQMDNINNFGRKAAAIKDIVTNKDFGQKDMEAVKKNMAEMVVNQLITQELQIGKSQGVRKAVATNKDAFLKSIMENEGFTSVFNELGTDGVKALFEASDDNQTKSTIRKVIDQMTEKAFEQADKANKKNDTAKRNPAPVEKKNTGHILGQ